MKRVGMAAVLGSLAAVVLLASSSWACTAVARVEFEGGNAGVPGSQATLRGNAFEAGAPVELHWNGADGPVIARAVGPAFSVPITIPDVAPGPFYVVGVQRDAKGKVWRVPAAFQVLAPGERPASLPVMAGEAVGLSEPVPSDDGSSTTMALGVGLLSLGGVGLAVSSAVVAVRRRRVAVARIDDRS